MPRKSRMYLGGYPCHIVQRGVDRQATFFSEGDYLFYLKCLQGAAERYGVSVHAYVLMTNHVHLLMTPDSEDSISRVMQSLGRRYVQGINRQYARTGTLWESRHKSSLIDADVYLLACYRNIELNPVRARMCLHPGDYQWSSYRANALRDADPLIIQHRLFEEVGENPQSRRNVYRPLLNPGWLPKNPCFV